MGAQSLHWCLVRTHELPTPLWAGMVTESYLIGFLLWVTELAKCAGVDFGGLLILSYCTGNGKNRKESDPPKSLLCLVRQLCYSAGVAQALLSVRFPIHAPADESCHPDKLVTTMFPWHQLERATGLQGLVQHGVLAVPHPCSRAAAQKQTNNCRSVRCLTLHEMLSAIATAAFTTNGVDSCSSAAAHREFSILK